MFKQDEFLARYLWNYLSSMLCLDGEKHIPVALICY